jgi:hypothetical protein
VYLRTGGDKELVEVDGGVLRDARRLAAAEWLAVKDDDAGDDDDDDDDDAHLREGKELWDIALPLFRLHKAGQMTACTLECAQSPTRRVGVA